MDVEVKLKNSLYKIELYLIKVIPIFTAAIYLLNTVLSFVFDIDAPILSYLAGVSIFTLMFFYLSSYVFKFCEYHRMFIHYITFNWLLNIYDYYIGVPVTDAGIMTLQLVLFFAACVVALITHLKHKKHDT